MALVWDFQLFFYSVFSFYEMTSLYGLLKLAYKMLTETVIGPVIDC